MGKWKKLTAFAPALAAVIVAACAGISLNGYTAPVYVAAVGSGSFELAD